MLNFKKNIMKKLLFIFFFITLCCNAQQKESITTTDEEYNYLSNGYGLSIENGLEIKKGYSLKLLTDTEREGFKYEYFGFVNSQGITKALLIKMTKDKESKDKIIFLCIPFNRPDLMKDFNKQKEKRLGSGMYINYDHVRDILLTQYISLKENK